MLADIANRYVLLALDRHGGQRRRRLRRRLFEAHAQKQQGAVAASQTLGPVRWSRLVVALALYYLPKFSTEIAFPFIKTLRVNLDIFYIPVRHAGDRRFVQRG